MRLPMPGIPLLAVIALGCSDPPPPLTGQASWVDACAGTACASTPHYVRAQQGSPTAIVSCSLTPSNGGYNVSFTVAAIANSGQTFDDSNEGLDVVGFLPAVAQELRPQSATIPGGVTVKGSGWTVRYATIGASGNCHVFIDRLISGGFSGRISCSGLRDDGTMNPVMRTIRGNADAQNPDFGEFTFTNCSSG